MNLLNANGMNGMNNNYSNNLLNANGMNGMDNDYSNNDNLS